MLREFAMIPPDHAAATARPSEKYARASGFATPEGGTLSLFDWRPPAPTPKASTQVKELARVESRIGLFILQWCRAHLDAGERRFHLAELVEDVECQLGGAPDSASRILRQLRQQGHIAYRVISRSASLYELDGVREGNP